MWYFAYGSNMDAAQMARRCPGAVAEGPAVLPGWQLVFDTPSKTRGGLAANVVPASGHETHGVLWRVTAEHLEALDRAEGVRIGRYCREQVTVRGVAGDLLAVVYLSVAPVEPGEPPAAYLEQLLAGARAHGLPPAYIEWLAVRGG
ncbi:MAG: gamma-glutamylcyclotransferase [Dehalococcoidia bacterium]|nr:gamma-glutamylcyclotransferase [Dehalococcoidia bacterium]